MRLGIAVMIAAASCGRVGFDERAAPRQDAASIDADLPPIDAPGSASLLQAVGPGFVRAAQLAVPIAHGDGDLLIAGVYWNQTTDAVVVSNTFGSTWASLPPQIVPTGCDECGASNAQLYYARATMAGSDTITVSQGSAVCPIGMFVLDYTGLSTTDVRASGEVAAGSSSVITTPPLTTASASVLVSLFVDGHNMGTIGVGSGLHLESVDAVFYAAVAASDAVPAGTYAPTATLPGSQSDACWAAAVGSFPL